MLSHCSGPCLPACIDVKDPASRVGILGKCQQPQLQGGSKDPDDKQAKSPTQKSARLPGWLSRLVRSSGITTRNLFRDFVQWSGQGLRRSVSFCRVMFWESTGYGRLNSCQWRRYLMKHSTAVKGVTVLPIGRQLSRG